MNEHHQFIEKIEQTLGLAPSSVHPDKYRSVYEGHMFPEDSDMSHIRAQADSFAGQLLSTFRARRGTLTPSEICRTYNSRYASLGREKNNGVELPTLTHVVGALRRREAWLQELKGYEETDLWDEDLQICDQLQILILEAIDLRRHSDDSKSCT